MRIIRIIILIVSIASILLSLLFIADYHVLKSRANLVCLLLIVVSTLNIISTILSLKHDNKRTD